MFSIGTKSPRLPKSILQGGQGRLFLASIWEHPSQPEADAPLAQTSSRLKSVVTALRVTDVLWFDLASTRWLSERIPSHRLLTSYVSHLTQPRFRSYVIRIQLEDLLELRLRLCFATLAKMP